MENEEKGAKSATAMRRCAKAALFLSALKSKTNSEEQCRTKSEEEEEEEEEKMMRSEILDLKLQLLNEFKRMKFCASVTVLVLLLLMLFLFALLLFVVDSVMTDHLPRIVAD